MARIELEIDDKGEVIGEVPTAIDAIFKRIESESHGRGYGKGVQKAAEDAKRQIEDGIKAEVAKREALLPLEREKWSRIEEDNKSLSTRLIEHQKEADKTLKAREEAHAREILQRSEALATRNARIQGLVDDQIESLALASGARDESLSELKLVLRAYVGYTDDMEPFVKDADGQPRLLHGKPMPIKTFVKEYLDTHPHHRKPPAGVGGGARGGATFRGYSSEPVTADQARKRINEGDRSAGAIEELFQATRKRSAS